MKDMQGTGKFKGNKAKGRNGEYPESK